MPTEIKQRVKEILVETLDLEDVSIEEISDEMDLFESDLGLDSIDALELVVGLEKEFGVKFENSEESKHVLRNVNTLAAFIESRQVSS